MRNLGEISVLKFVYVQSAQYNFCNNGRRVVEMYRLDKKRAKMQEIID